MLIQVSVTTTSAPRTASRGSRTTVRADRPAVRTRPGTRPRPRTRAAHRARPVRRARSSRRRPSATRTPSSEPSRSRIVSASASAWHGCSSAVSAFSTGTLAHSAHASSSACACVRTASTSTYRESARAVSGSDSPRESCSSSGESGIERAAEVRDRDRERDPRPRRVLREVEPERRAGQQRRAVASQLDRRVEDRLRLCRNEVADPQQVAADERDLQRCRHDQRSRAAVTAAATSMPRRAGRVA